MNFRFKLSQRLARLKATLAVSVVLALACQSDLTDPKPPYSSPRPSSVAADLTPLTAASVVASGNDGNLPQNTVDKSLATRWSAQGDGQWIRYDLGALVAIDHLDIAWYLGDTRIASFDIQVSPDTVTWTKVFSGQSSGQTLQLERYAFPTTSGRYVRIVGHGNSSSTWNSITEVAILSTAVPALSVPVVAVTVNPASASLTVSATAQLTATPKDSNGTALSGRAVTWASNNPAVATVSPSGLVTGVAAGSATITATSEGQSGTATVTVTNVPVASVTVSPASPSIAVGQTVQLAAVTKDAAGNVLTGRTVTWTTSNSTVATVLATGLVTGVAAGTATITATSEAVAGTAASTVTAPVSNPGTVTDLAVVGVTDTGVTLAFTEVNAGTGLPANYDVRDAVGTISWGGTAQSVTRGTCATPVAGTAIGAKRTCTVLGLTPATAYQFQLVAFRGTLNLNAVFGGLSNITGATTAPST